MRSGNLISELLCLLCVAESHLAFAARSLVFILRMSAPLFTCAVCCDMWIWESTRGSLPSVSQVTNVSLVLASCMVCEVLRQSFWRSHTITVFVKSDPLTSGWSAYLLLNGFQVFLLHSLSCWNPQ